MNKQAFNRAFDLGIREVAIKLEKHAEGITSEQWSKAFAAAEGGEPKKYKAKGKAAAAVLKSKEETHGWYNPTRYVGTSGEMAEEMARSKK